MKDTLLEIIDLNKDFSIRSNIIDIIRFKTPKKIKVIDNINLKLCKGEILVVAGESGSGKTTLAKLIMRSIQSDSGKIIFNDRDITNIKGKELLKVKIWNSNDFSRSLFVFRSPNEDI